MTDTLPKQATFAAQPAPWAEALDAPIQQALDARPHKLVVLDDDPTGTQTVHGVPVVTKWDVATLEAALREAGQAVFVLTNTRSMTEVDAVALSEEVGRNLAAAARTTGVQAVIISRSDSTLRGHYPAEVDAAARGLGEVPDGVVLMPFFEEGGRFTLGATHYVAEGDDLVPAAHTPFAKDAAFGFKSSYLPDWIEEKTKGAIPAARVLCVSLDDVRRGGPDRVAAKLMDATNGQPVVCDALCRRDMEVFVAGLLQAEASGKTFLYRTAASFVAVRAANPARPLLGASELNDSGSKHGGLVVVGSYVPKTTAQLQELLAVPGLESIEIDVDSLLDEGTRRATIDTVVANAAKAIAAGRDVVLYTSRKLRRGDDGASSLSIGNTVSESLVELTKSIDARPRYLLAKGGITSSDLATKAMGVQRATVMGQVLPGIPVWQLGPETRHPGLAYIVFPGNVGSNAALAEVVSGLRLPSSES